MPVDQSTRKRILERVRSRFFSSGFSKVTMDELAHDLGVSKKTIYKHFPSKNELLRELLKLKMDRFGLVPPGEKPTDPAEPDVPSGTA